MGLYKMFERNKTFLIKLRQILLSLCHDDTKRFRNRYSKISPVTTQLICTLDDEFQKWSISCHVVVDKYFLSSKVKIDDDWNNTNKTMASFRLAFLSAIFAMAWTRGFSFRSTTRFIKTVTRKLSTQLAASGTKESGTQNTSEPQKKQHPRAAVSIALRCFCGNDPKAHYLLIRRGNEPNKGKWALPGGKLEWGEATLDGARRELFEEVIFCAQDKEASSFEIVWCPEPYATADAIAQGFHYLIAVCFAEYKPKGNTLPRVKASDDAIDARWWSMDEILQMEEDALLGTHGFVRRMKRTEFLYQQGILICNETGDV